MRITISYPKEGSKRDEYSTQTELPLDKTWPELQEYIRLLVKTAIKYSGEKVPEGLLKEGEAL